MHSGATVTPRGHTNASKETGVALDLGEPAVERHIHNVKVRKKKLPEHFSGDFRVVKQ